MNWREKIKLSVKVVTTIWITTNFRITFHFYCLLRLFNEFHVKLQNNIQLSFHDQPQHDKHGSRKLCEAKEIYRRYIGPSCTRSALARQLIWKGILIYRRYIGGGCTRSAVEFLKVFTTNGHPPTDTYPPIVGRIYPIPEYIQTAYILQFCIIYNVYIQHEYI